MKKLLALYRDECKFFRKRLARTFLMLCGLFIVAILISLLFFHLTPATAQRAVRQLEIRYGDWLHFSQPHLFISILAGNLLTAFVTILLGWIPVPIFPLLPLLKNSFESAAFVCVSGEIPSLTFTAAILPHGIIEVPAIIFATTLGVQFSRSRMQKRKRMLTVDSVKEDVADSMGFFRSLRSYALIVIPSLVLAALVETYLTPLIISMTTR